MRGFPVQSFPGAVVQTVHDHGEFLIGHGMKRPGLGQVLARQAVGIFVGSPLPGGIGIGEVGCGFEGAIDLAMPGKLQAVVEGQRADASLERAERLHNDIPDRLAGLAGHMGQQTEVGLAFDQTDDGLFVAGADQRIALPVADAATRLETGGTL
jgi:hypothetical protein